MLKDHKGALQLSGKTTKKHLSPSILVGKSKQTFTKNKSSQKKYLNRDFTER